MSARLYLVRHGEAAPAAEGLRDELRPLTRAGRKQVRELGRCLRRLGVRFDRLYHSPLLRALETAELLTARLDGESVVDPRLAGGSELELLAALRGERIALVGHQPQLGELAALLACGWRPVVRSGERAAIAIAPGGLCVLEGELRPGGMRLRGLYTAEALRRLSGGA